LGPRQSQRAIANHLDHPHQASKACHLHPQHVLSVYKQENFHSSRHLVCKNPVTSQDYQP
jgi:hypothetical protein